MKVETTTLPITMHLISGQCFMSTVQCVLRNGFGCKVTIFTVLFCLCICWMVFSKVCCTPRNWRILNVSLNIKRIPACNPSFSCPGLGLSLSCFVSFPCLSYFSLERLPSMFLGTYVLWESYVWNKSLFFSPVFLLLQQSPEGWSTPLPAWQTRRG